MIKHFEFERFFADHVILPDLQALSATRKTAARENLLAGRWASRLAPDYRRRREKFLEEAERMMRRLFG